MFQVVDIMRVNVDKVLERDQKLSELDDRAGKKLFSCITFIISSFRQISVSNPMGRRPFDKF